MTIYVEDVLLNSCAFQLLILYLSAVISDRRIKWLNIFFCAFVMAIVYTLCLLGGGVIFMVVYFVISPVLFLVFLQFRHFKEYITYLLIALVLKLSCIGIVFITSLFISINITSIFYIYGKIPAIGSAALLIISVDVVYLKKNLMKIVKSNINLHKVQLIGQNGYRCQTIGYYDTGNNVCAKNGEGVIIMENGLYNKFEISGGERVIISTIAGSKTFYGTKILLRIYFEDGTNKIYKAIAVGGDIGTNKYKIILHNSMR